jgi:hypothetical protein
MNIRLLPVSLAASLARILVVLAVLTMSLDLHPAHGRVFPDAGAGDHMGDSCAAEDPKSGADTSLPDAQGDCAHGSFSLVQGAHMTRLSCPSGQVEADNTDLFPQPFHNFDPPPPRLPV